MKLEFRNIKKSYDGKEVLHGLSFEVESGRPMAFLGRNGAGKTTTIRALMGVFDPDEGEILLDGKKIDFDKVSFGYLPEERGMYGKDKILRQLIYFASLRGNNYQEAKKSAEDLIEKVGLSEYKNKNLETLSKGNQQKIQICEAMLCDPDILVLDEPFSGLDPMNSQILMNLIKEYGSKDKIILFSSHQMSYVEEICDDITLIDSGEVILTGDLKKTRRELGHNKLRLEADNFTMEELEDLLYKNISYISITNDRNSLIIDIGSLSKEEFVKKLLELGVSISKFENYQPTVADIFINYVGKESNDEKHL